MPDADKPTGWRKPTPAMIAAEKYAQKGATTAVSKARAMSAVKRVGVALGLKAADMLLIDSFGAFTQPQDWGRGQRPIVWASNACLMERTGFSLSALKRHLKRLASLGIIAFQDSPNGKRWGHRDANGLIVEAYGIDLSPLAARAEEFEHIHAHVSAERALLKRLKRQLTITRRTLRSRLNAVLPHSRDELWSQLRDAFEMELSALPSRVQNHAHLEDALAVFESLLIRVRDAFGMTADGNKPVENPGISTRPFCKNSPEMDPKEPKNEPHIQPTNQPESVNEKTVTKTPYRDNQRNSRLEPDAQERHTEYNTISTEMIVKACPEFMAWVANIGHSLRSWADLHHAAGHLRGMIGIADRDWGSAQKKLGPQIASAALALVFEKYCRGEIQSPVGYLRGLTRKAGAGELHLDRSFYGRIAGGRSVAV